MKSLKENYQKMGKMAKVGIIFIVVWIKIHLVKVGNSKIINVRCILVERVIEKFFRGVILVPGGRF